MQKQADQQRTERTELLLRVFKDINKFLGSEVSYLLPFLLQFCRGGARLMSRTTKPQPISVYSAIPSSSALNP
jgi:hypothetical protein